MTTSRIDEVLRWIRGPAVLDIGCTAHDIEFGSPYWLHGHLRKRFPKVAGIDISEENIRIMREAGYSDVYVQSAEAINLDEQFDTVIAGELIEHLGNPGQFLASARKHIRPGGRLVLTTPNPFSLSYSAYALLKYPKTCSNAQHTIWLCRETLKNLLERYGYRVVHFGLVGYYRPDDPSRLYRAGLRVLKLISPVLPARLSYNTMLVVAEPVESEQTEQSKTTPTYAAERGTVNESIVGSQLLPTTRG